jgi:hypothetical protein
MDTPWIMFFSKRQKVASQELSVEPGCVSGKLSCLAVDQKEIKGSSLQQAQVARSRQGTLFATSSKP